MKKSIAALVAVAGLAAASDATPVAQAHSCSTGTKHAVINGGHKCLKTGQFCAKAKASSYRQYGFKCVAASDGRFRLKKT